MVYSPWTQGDRRPTWTIKLTPSTGTFDITGLTAANFSMRITNTDTQNTVNGTGTFTNLTAATSTSPATIQYIPSAADAVNLGNFQPYAKITFPDTTSQTITLDPWEVIPSH